MNIARPLSIVWTSLIVVVLCGCQQPSMEDMMKPPARPAELDQLNAFIGEWDGTAEITMPGSDKTMTGRGHSVARWAADKWAMIEEYEESGGDEQPTKGLAVWTWDPEDKEFRAFWTGSHGGWGHGSIRYDEKTDTWHMTAHSENPYNGMKTVGEGTVKFPDANTQEWSYTEWGPWKMKKLFEMKGTSHRK